MGKTLENLLKTELKINQPDKTEEYSLKTEEKTCKTKKKCGKSY